MLFFEKEKQSNNCHICITVIVVFISSYSGVFNSEMYEYSICSVSTFDGWSL